MKKKYTIELTKNDNQTIINRKNDVFSVVELLGILEIVKSDLLDLIKNHSKRTIDKTIRKSKNSKFI